MKNKIKEIVKDSITKARYNALFNELLLNSLTYVKVKVKYNRGFEYKALPIENTQLNKYFLRT